MSLAAWSYATAAIAFVAGALATAGGSALVPAARVRLGFLVSAAWAAMVAAQGMTGGPLDGYLSRLLPLAEILRYGSLFLLMSALSNTGAGTWLRRLNLWSWVAALVIVVLGGLTLKSGRATSLPALVLAMIGLVNVEQVLRGAATGATRTLQLCAVGIGGQFAYDLFLFSQAELLGGLSERSWAARGLVLAALVPFAVAGIRRMAHEQPKLFVSRHVVFYTTAVLSIGVYLLVMAFGGYFVRSLGGSWGESLSLLFLVGAGAVLAMLLLSQSTWRHIRVFVAKHFYRNKYDYRLEWLRFIKTLSNPGRGDARVISIRAIAQILESPGGVLFLRAGSSSRYEAEASWFEADVAQHSYPALAADADLPGFLADRQWVIDIREYVNAPDLYGDIQLPEWLTENSAGWRIVNPLLELDQLVGFLVLQAPPEPFQMTYEDRDLLRTVGRHVATLLQQQAADSRLAESRQFDAFNRFGAFVMHDLKNSVAQLQLLVNNAARHRNNPQFLDDAVETIGHAVARMTRLIEQLQTRGAAEAIRSVPLLPLLRAVEQRCSRRTPAVRFVMADTPELAVTADADRLGAVLDHVVRNAQDAAGMEGSVSMQLGVKGPWVRICIQDDGPGMSREFVQQRLFRPFDSTKGSKGMGIGAYQTREYVRQLGGDVEVQSRPGEGTRFSIILPLCPLPNASS
jgi:putative PEP-CTERM system histidine kinase